MVALGLLAVRLSVHMPPTQKDLPGLLSLNSTLTHYLLSDSPYFFLNTSSSSVITLPNNPLIFFYLLLRSFYLGGGGNVTSMRERDLYFPSPVNTCRLHERR